MQGANGTDFSASFPCANLIAAGGNCPISVFFSPTAVGTRTATLAIADNASASPQTVSLSGTAAQATISVAPASLAFGNQTMFSQSSPQAVTISNTGTVSANISYIYFSGANTGDFSYSAGSSSCWSGIPVGGNCVISVTFNPYDPGALTAQLTLADNASGNPHIVQVTGTGLMPATPPGTYTIPISAYAYGNGTSDIHQLSIPVTVQ